MLKGILTINEDGSQTITELPSMKCPQPRHTNAYYERYQRHLASRRIFPASNFPKEDNGKVVGYELQYKEADIYCEPGYKVIGHFVDGILQGGYDGDKLLASKYIKEGVEYTIDYAKVGDWRTDFYLKEFPGNSFNSVHFLSAIPIAIPAVKSTGEGKEDGIGPEVRDVKLWPPDKDGWYWCIVQGVPAALGKWMLKLQFVKEEGGFLQEDDGYHPIQYLTNDPVLTSQPVSPANREGEKEDNSRILVIALKSIAALSECEGSKNVAKEALEKFASQSSPDKGVREGAEWR